MKTIGAEWFRDVLRTKLRQAELAGHPYLEVLSADLHRELGGYPAPAGGKHEMPTCCNVMRELMKAGDEVLASPPKGRGATLKIRYKLPRR